MALQPTGIASAAATGTPLLLQGTPPGAVTFCLAETQIMEALVGFISNMLIPGIEVVRGVDNRVSEPIGPDFIEVTPTLREPLSTPVTTYSDGWPDAASTMTITQPMQISVQIDVHGPNSAENAQAIASTMRTEWVVDAFAQTGFDVTPLYSSPARFTAFTNAEEQQEFRWTIDAVMQANECATVPQEFAGAVGPVGLINVDAT